MEVFSLAVRLKEEGSEAVEAALKKLKVSSVVTAAAIGTALVGALSKLRDETVAAQAAQAQLEAVLRSTGGAAGLSAGALNAQAAALQATTNFADDAVTGAQALLLTFTQIRGENFTRATEAIADVATAMGTDLKGAAIQVGKALNDPIAGLSALSRSGIQFTETQKETIKQLVETGRVAEAQRVILKELETQFGGSAAAARNTLGGALDGLANAFGDLFEMSESSTSGVVRLLNGLESALITLNERMEDVKSVAIGMLAAFTVSKFRLIVSAVTSLSTGLVSLAGALSTATIRQWALNAAQSANPIGAMATALGLATSATLMYANAQQRAAEERDEEIAKSPAYLAALDAIRGRREALLQLAQDERREQERQAGAAGNRQENLARLAGITRLTAAQMRELVTAEQGYAAALRVAGLPLDKQVELLEKQKMLQDAIAAQRGRSAGAVAEATRQTETQTLADRAGARALQATAVSTDNLIASLRRLREERAQSAAAARNEREAEAIATVGVTLERLPKPTLPANLFGELTASQEAARAAAALRNDISTTFANAVGGAIQDGFTSGIAAAISSGRISDAWKAMSQAIIQNLSSAMVNVALTALKFGEKMAQIRNFLILRPELAVAAAAAMLAFAYANGGKAQSAGTAVTGGIGGATFAPMVTPQNAEGQVTRLIFGGTSATTAAGMTPRQATNITIIGPDDPKAQRAIEELIRRGQSRGTLG